MLFNIAVCLCQQENYLEASFYLSKVHQSSDFGKSLRDKSMELLSQVYYKMKIYNNCKEILSSHIKEGIAQAYHKGFSKSLFIYYSACKRINSFDEETLSLLKNYVKEKSANEDNEDTYILCLYYSLFDHISVDQCIAA